jgi:hypothetical protein
LKRARRTIELCRAELWRYGRSSNRSASVRLVLFGHGEAWIAAPDSAPTLGVPRTRAGSKPLAVHASKSNARSSPCSRRRWANRPSVEHCVRSERRA